MGDNVNYNVKDDKIKILMVICSVNLIDGCYVNLI